MNTTLVPLLSTLAGLFRSRARLHLEVLALRQQLAMVTHRDPRRFCFRRRERFFWVWLYTLWPGCVDTLRILKPDTLMRWHRRGFQLYWTWRSRFRRGGRKSPHQRLEPWPWSTWNAMQVKSDDLPPVIVPFHKLVPKDLDLPPFLYQGSCDFSGLPVRVLPTC